MQLHQLEYFVAVAEERGFTAAATRLRVAQPGVSAQVRKLERELGHPLFDRSGPRVVLTAVGAEALAPARAALAAVAGVRRVVDDLDGLLRGTVRVGMVTTGPFLDLPDRLADFTEAHPAVEVTLAVAASASLVGRLRDGTLDLALVGVTGPDPEGLGSVTVTEETLVAVVRDDDPLAGRRAVDPADLVVRPLVAPAAGTALREALEAVLGTGGARVAFEATDPALVLRMVRRGLGVTVLPDSVLPADGLRGVALAGPRVRARLALAWRGDVAPSPAGAALRDRLLDHLASRP